MVEGGGGNGAFPTPSVVGLVEICDALREWGEQEPGT